jgi:hypothetical protein
MLHTTCKACGGKVTFNEAKLTTVIGGGILITAIAAAFGLGGGWLALGGAALGGSTIANVLLRAKLQLAKHSSQLGGVFRCSRCGRDVPVLEVFAGIGEVPPRNEVTSCKVVDHVEVNGESGVRVDFHAVVSNGKSRQAQARLYLYEVDGEPSRNYTVPGWTAPDAHVCAVDAVRTLPTDESPLSGSIFLPYRAFPEKIFSGYKQFKLRLAIYDQARNVELSSVTKPATIHQKRHSQTGRVLITVLILAVCVPFIPMLVRAYESVANLVPLSTWMSMLNDSPSPEEAASAAREAAWVELQRFKTDHAANEDHDSVERAFSLASSAQDAYATPEGEALMALAGVWKNKWHHASATWSAERFATDSSRTASALESDLPEAYLARALLLGNACHLMPAGGVQEETCSEALSMYEKSEAAFSNDPRKWLWFESTWTFAAALNEQAKLKHDGDNDGLAAELWGSTVSLCASAAGRLGDGPVNGPELVEECAEAAGALGDLQRWNSLVAWLRANDRPANGGPSVKALAAAYRSPHPACHGLHLERHSEYNVLVPDLSRPGHSTGTDRQYFCYAAGLVALGCKDLYQEIQPFARKLAPQMPWEDLSRLHDSVTSVPACLLTMP